MLKTLSFAVATLVTLPAFAQESPESPAPAPAPPLAPAPASAPAPQDDCQACGFRPRWHGWHAGYTPVLAARHPLLGSSTGIVRNGGLFFAVGPRFDTVATRLRGGYEIGFGRAVVLAGAFESDARERNAVIPTLEIASGRWGMFPSLGIGGGVPVQWRKDDKAYAGARVQATMSWGIGSLLFTYDNYPSAPPGYRTESALAFQLSL